MTKDIVEAKELTQVSDNLYKGVTEIIDNARQEVVVYVNKHSDMMFWHIGHYVNEDMGYKQYSAYGNRILATLSQRLTARQPDENPPIGLLLCSEGNTEHIELMMLNEDHIKVAQYLTCLPDKQWFIDKLNRSILIAKEYGGSK